MNPALRLLRTPTFRLAAIYLVLFGVSVAALLAFVYMSTLGVIDRQTDATIDAEVRGLAEQYDLLGLGGLVRVIRERSAQNRDRKSVYLLTDRFGDSLAGNLSAWPTPDSSDGQWIAFSIRKQADGPDQGDDQVHQVRALGFQLPGRYRLLVGRDIHDRTLFRSATLRSMGWALAITLILGLAGGLLMSRNMLRRLEAINQASRRIMQGDLHERVPIAGSGDEFDRLSGNLNDMLDRIEQLMAGMREVTDNVAHDLKGPLARLRARLESTLREGGQAGDYRAAVEQTIVEADRLLATFNALLNIAEIEAGMTRCDEGPVDLSAVAGDVAELYGPVAENQGLHFASNLAPGVEVRGNRELLFQLLANLLDNAIKYTPAGGSVTLALTVDGDSADCVVADSGPGIPVSDRDKVLTRYVRLDASRSTPGSGLGLSLVAAVARGHGARLLLQDNHPGLRATVVFGRHSGEAKSI